MTKISRFLYCGVAALSLLAPHVLNAQVGNDNPTGPSGIFNGSINTAGSYDPYTGNISRTVTDISVAGTVGTIPLAFSRIYNSRNTNWIDFGIAGFWTHNYHWFLNDSASRFFTSLPGPFSPTSYSVLFPDGRWETFATSSFDTYYRAAAGTADRFIALNTTTSLAYLVFPDGSKLEILGTEHITQTSAHSWTAYYTYVAQALIDAYGLRTTFTYNTDGTLQKITEPGGRWIQLYYQTNGVYIDHVTASDGRSVQYYYGTAGSGYTCLDHVVYYSDATLTARYQYCASNSTLSGTPLLYTCDDPMYPGPMRRIGYVYRTTNNPDGTQPVYGQVLSENYFDGTNVGAALTTLTVNNSTTRTETRADGKTRTFTYSSGLLTSCTDFKNVSASQTYDTHSYINAVTDRNNHTTNYTLNALTGAVLTATFPLTAGDTPPSTPRGVITYTYGWATCPDVNNRDANNPYYLYSITDEGGHATIFMRDSSKRVTRIDYPDGGYETFSYNSFNQVLSHLMKTGGTETFSYDARGLKQTYRDPYHASGNPTAWYQYDTLDRISGVTDTLGSAAGDVNHTTSYTYNLRGQQLIVTHPTDPNDGLRHTVQNSYNPDGTVASVTDELNHVTSFTYDDYRRPLTKVTPQRYAGDSTPRATYTYYDATGTGNDYTHTDSNVTYVKLPSGKKVKTTYDENYRKTSVTAGEGTSDAAKTSYGYDNVGNVTSVISPKEQPGQVYAGKSTVTAYDERNRPMSITDALNDSATFQYDAAGRKYKITRPNGQLTTFSTYDAMNRVLQQTVSQSPTADAVMKYTYYASGLLHTFQDPKLSSGSDNYSYSYDQMGRKTGLTYPSATPGASPKSEAWHYDTAGRNDTFTNRDSKVQTSTYDGLNRATNVSWNDSGVTPTVTFGYDAASRITSVINANATISRSYFNDNLLNTETTTYADATARTITYLYDADANRVSVQYPNNAYSFGYTYTNRNQLQTITSGANTVISYVYDLDGNLSTRTPANSTSSTYSYDALERVIGISHAFAASNTRTLGYSYDSVGNRNWTQRDGNKGDVFDYDDSDQVIATKLDITNPTTTAPGPQTIVYDANGNRTSFAAYGTTDTYSTNNLNQYTARNTSNAAYNNNGSMTTGLDGSTYTYDAQDRVLTATKGSTTYTFTYDGLNRQVTRKIGTASPIYNIYDGWDLIGEYNGGSTSPTTAYLTGAGGLVKLMTLSSSYFYYQDASGCTSHLADNSGNLVEWYRYDLHGAPSVYDPSNILRSGGSFYGIRHLFTGQQWYSDLGLYDLRNRFYSPDIGRFLQADPIGFGGDPTNIYRYCGNNPLKRSDAAGMRSIEDRGHGGGHFTNVVARFASLGITLRGDDYCNLDGSQGGSPLSEGCLTGADANWAFLAIDPAFNGIRAANATAMNGTVIVGPVSAADDTDGGGSNAASVEEGRVVVGPTITYIFEAPPGALPNEAFNPEGTGWIYGGEVSYAEGVGGGYGSQTIVFANGQCAYYTYVFAGGGVGGVGLMSYEGQVFDCYWPSQYSGAFVSIGGSPGPGLALTPNMNGASSLTWNTGSPGATASYQNYTLQSVWWGGGR